MRAYYDIAMEIIPGWWRPKLVTVKRDAKIRRDELTLARWPRARWFSGKSDLVVAYPGLQVDQRKWRVPPHVELANIGYSKREYGEHERESRERTEAWMKVWAGKSTGVPFSPSKHGYTGHQPTAEEIARFIRTYGTLKADSAVAHDPVEIFVAEFRELQEELRFAWRRGDAKLLWFVRGAEETNYFDIPFTWAGDELALRPADLWTYVRLLLTRDLSTGHAKVCKYPQCDTPFTVKKRTDGECCSHECATKFTNWKNSLGKKAIARR